MKSLFRINQCLMALGLAALVACTSSPDKRVLQYLNTEGYGKRYTGNSLQDDYLTIGDRISFVDSYNSFGGAETISIDGTINFDQAGRVWVAGMTKEQAEVYLTEKALTYYPNADIKVLLSPKAKTFWMLGEVGGKGRQSLTEDLTLFDAVMLANPSDHTANLGRVRLIRADPVDPLVFTANLSQMYTEGDSTFNFVIQENDIIVVPPTMLAQIGYFISDLVTPFTQVFSSVFKGLLSVSKFSNLGGNNKSSSVF
jgi:protein involved in polysaccharide export with SLBB domain